jgi:predicted phage terminase large subunit-like protein
MNAGPSAAATWSAADEAEWFALQESLYGGEPLSNFIGRVNPRFPPPPHLKQLTDLFDEARHHPVFAIVSLPPRHRKTTTCDNAIAQLLKEEPTLTHGFFTYSDRKARTESRRIRSIATAAGVRMDPTRRSLNEWGVLYEGSDGGLRQGGGLWAAGWNGGGTGIGITGVLLVDDILKGRKQANSVTLRDDHWDWFCEVALSRLEPGASVIIVMTRWHEDDLIGRLTIRWAEMVGDLKLKEGVNIPDWRVVRLAAICDDERDGTARKLGEPLWPEQYGIPYLDLRRRLNPDAFQGLYQQDPRAPGSQMFLEPTRYHHEELMRLGAEGFRCVIAVDPAASDSDSACHWAAELLWARGYGADMEAYLVDEWYEQTDPITGAEKIDEMQRLWGAPVVIEGGTVGKAVLAMLKRLQPDLEVVEVIPDKDKRTRAAPAAALWNRGKLRIPIDAPWAAKLIKHAKEFRGKSSAEADQVDAIAHGVNWLLDVPPPDASASERESHMPLW